LKEGYPNDSKKWGFKDYFMWFVGWVPNKLLRKYKKQITELTTNDKDDDSVEEEEYSEEDKDATG
jgi:hypothetical protein